MSTKYQFIIYYQVSSKKERLWVGIPRNLFHKNIVTEKGKALKFFVLKMDKKFSVKNEALNREKTLERLKVPSPSKKAVRWIFKQI